MHQFVVVMDGDLKIKSVNQAFYRTFGTDKQKTEGKAFYELGNGQWDLPELRRLLGEILPKNSSFENFQVEHEFPGIGRRRIMLNARRLVQDDGQKILLAMEDVTDRRES